MGKHSEVTTRFEESALCPFCGGMPYLRITPASRYFVYCENTESCGCSTNFKNTKEDAIKLWQTRGNNEFIWFYSRVLVGIYDWQFRPATNKHPV